MRHRETETPALTLTLFGGFEARRATGALATPPTKKAQALLAYLAIRPGQRHGRDKLAALLWGERRDTHARGDLRQALVALRRALGDAAPATLLIEGQTLAVRDAGVEVDVATFEQRIAAGTPEAFEHATELYRGDLLFGFALNEPLFEEWLVAERERLREVALDALARLLAHQANAGATERAIRTAIRLIALDPLQEPVHRALMRLYARRGRRGAEAVPGVRRRARARAWDDTGGGDEAALSGALAPSDRARGTARNALRGRPPRRERPIDNAAGSARRGDADVRPRGGAGVVARSAGSRHPGHRTSRRHRRRGRHRQDAARRCAGRGRARAEL